MSPLSAEESRVAAYLAAGKTRAEIRAVMGLRGGELEGILRQAYRRTGTTDEKSLAEWGRRQAGS